MSRNGESSASPRERIVQFWTDLDSCDDTGQTTWEVLGPMQQEVTDCLEKDDLGKAMSISAKAMLLINGQIES